MKRWKTSVVVLSINVHFGIKSLPRNYPQISGRSLTAKDVSWVTIHFVHILMNPLILKASCGSIYNTRTILSRRLYVSLHPQVLSFTSFQWIFGFLPNLLKCPACFCFSKESPQESVLRKGQGRILMLIQWEPVIQCHQVWKLEYAHVMLVCVCVCVCMCTVKVSSRFHVELEFRVHWGSQDKFGGVTRLLEGYERS